mmetsp:Transcript_10141/g.1506  ORF Transcript_10141/g.1506 Transcript_10141/m.1506 type:complete len:126 (+) Transcript_10141:2055-2432(+)
MLEDLLDLADDFGPGDSFPYNTEMLYYEQAAVLYPTTWIFISVVILLNGLVNFVLSLRISSTLLSMVTNLAIVLSMFLSMWILGAEFNVVTILHLFMGAILGAEFSTHITHAFVSRPGDRKERLV